MPNGQIPAKTPEGRAKQAADQIRWAETRRRVTELKLAGLTFEQIARALGFKNKSTPYRIWCKAMRDVPKPAADLMRKQYDQRTDKALRTAFEIMGKADVDAKVRLQACDTVDRLERNRAAVLGFGQPQQHRVAGPQGGPVPVAVAPVDYGDLAEMTDAELAEAREALAQAVQAVGVAAAAGAAGPGAGATEAGEDDGG